MADAAAARDRKSPEVVARFLGRQLTSTYEVVEWVPGERFVMGTAHGPRISTGAEVAAVLVNTM